MIISSPKSFKEVPAPRRDGVNAGRPRSELLKALENLKVNQFIEVKLKPGQPPSIDTVRASLPRWQRVLGRVFNHRTSDDGNAIEIYRTK